MGTFLEIVKKVDSASPSSCPHARYRRLGFFFDKTGWFCRVCEDLSIFNNTNAIDPCSLEDFNSCPLFPHGEKK